MKIAGHTMGTPELNLYGAMKLFHRLGYDGIEIRCAKDGQLDTTTVDQEYLDLIKKWQEWSYAADPLDKRVKNTGTWPLPTERSKRLPADE